MGEVIAHRIDIRCQFRRLGNDGAIKVANHELALCELFDHVTQQYPAVDILKLRIIIREVSADIAECGGTKQGVTDCVEQHIGIGMPGQAFVVGYFNTTKQQWPIVGKGMDIKTLTYTHRLTLIRIQTVTVKDTRYHIFKTTLMAQKKFGQCQVFRARDLDIIRTALDHNRLPT
jgi:hypothetical protein